MRGEVGRCVALVGVEGRGVAVGSHCEALADIRGVRRWALERRRAWRGVGGRFWASCGRSLRGDGGRRRAWRGVALRGVEGHGVPVGGHSGALKDVACPLAVVRAWRGRWRGRA
jgi:hypothetical protein